MLSDTNAQQPRDTPPPSRVSRLLGPTAGANDGNVRAVLAVLAMVFIHSLFIVLLVGYMRGSAVDLKDFVQLVGGGLLTLDVGAVSWYFGKRSGETQ